jgi:hypothetical protein
MQSRKICSAEMRDAPGRDDAIHGFDAKAWNAEQVFTAGAIDVERKPIPVAQSPGEFGIYVEWQHAAFERIGDLVDVEAIKRISQSA